MNDPLPSVSVPFEQHGYGTLSKNEHSCDVAFTLIRDKYAHSQPWLFHATPTASQSTLYAVLSSGDLNDPIRLKGRIDSGWREILIPALSWPTTKGHVLKSEVWSFEVSEGKADLADTDWRATVYLTENPLALPQVEVRFLDPRGLHESHGEEREPISWQEPLGRVEFSRLYAFEDVSVGGVKASLEIPHPSIGIRIADRHQYSASSILDEIEARLSVTLRLLSFFGRRRTMWTRISLTARNIDRAEWYNINRFREAGDRSTPTYLNDSLLDPLHLQVALDHGVLRRFEEHPQHAEISTGVDLLLTSREKAIVFGSHRFVSAFTAFETVVNAYSEAAGFAKAIRGNQERRFLSQIRRLVGTFSSAEGLDPEIVEAVREKAPEMTRISFVRRAWRTLSDLNIHLVDLWPVDTDFRAELQSITSRRNALVHSGHEIDIQQAFPDEVRLNLLTERILLGVTQLPQA